MTLPNPDDQTHVVYTTMNPDTRLEVSTAERDELAAQGLIAREEERPEVKAADEARTARQRTSSGATEPSETA